MKNSRTNTGLGSRAGVLSFLFGIALAAAALTQWSEQLLQSPIETAELASVDRSQLELRGNRLCLKEQSAPFTGLMLDRYSDGKVSLRTGVVEGRLEGLSEGWFTNGTRQLKEYFHAGVAEGTRTTWHSNGLKRSQGKLAAGLQEGLYRQWDEQGSLMVEAHFERGKPHGLSLAWYGSGYLKTEAVVWHGQVQDRRDYPDYAQSKPSLAGDGPAITRLTSNK